MTLSQTPIEVIISPQDQALHIRWRDSHLGTCPFDVLRGACPCAVCKGRHGSVDVTKVTPVPGAQVLDVMPVGSYAVRLLWSDGHSTGIYRHAYLRALCRCQECSGRQNRPLPEDSGPAA